MTKLIGTIALSGTLALVPALSRAQYDEWTDSPGAAEEPAPPPSQAPGELPPAPPSATAPAPSAEPQASVPAGQWVYTQQYGWIWMPYGDDYTSVPPDGYGAPYAYVFYPSYGWAWLAAPWVWGIGPWPFFGVVGPARFAWYSHGWWRYPARWHYAPSYGGGRYAMRSPAYQGGRYAVRPAPAYRGFAGYGARPMPYRGGSGYGARGPAPYRGAPSFSGGRGGGFAPHPAFAARGGFGSGGAHFGGRGGGFGGHFGGGGRR
jgi:hypothetical protein